MSAKTPKTSELGKRFVAARESSGLSHKEVSKRSGVAVSLLTDIAVGSRMPRVDSMEKVAAALGVSPGWLVYGEGPMPEWIKKVPGLAS